jgi:pectate lyase
MQEILDRYAVVTVADLYELSDRSPNYMDNNYGWTSLKHANVHGFFGSNGVRKGYVIDLPTAMPLETLTHDDSGKKHIVIRIDNEVDIEKSAKLVAEFIKCVSEKSIEIRIEKGLS